VVVSNVTITSPFVFCVVPTVVDESDAENGETTLVRRIPGCQG